MPTTIISKKKPVAAHPHNSDLFFMMCADVIIMTSFQFSPVITIKTVSDDYPIVLKLYRVGSSSSSSKTPEKNCFPISAFMKMKISMSSPKFAESGADRYTTCITLRRLTQLRISLKIRIKRNPRNIETPLVDSEKRLSLRDSITITPSKIFIGSLR